MRRGTSIGSTLVGLIMVLALIGAACSKGATTSTTGSAPTGGSGGVATLQQGPGGALVFAPTTLSVKQGTSITVANVGSVPHTFTITGKGIDIENQAGQSQQVTINLPAGTYPFICRFHVSLGMKGTLTVT